jgi:hypothetical protein
MTAYLITNSKISRHISLFLFHLLFFLFLSGCGVNQDWDFTTIKDKLTKEITEYQASSPQLANDDTRLYVFCNHGKLHVMMTANEHFDVGVKYEIQYRFDTKPIQSSKNWIVAENFIIPNDKSVDYLIQNILNSDELVVRIISASAFESTHDVSFSTKGANGAVQKVLSACKKAQ